MRQNKKQHRNEVSTMDYNKAALELHSKYPGKIAVQSLCVC